METKEKDFKAPGYWAVHRMAEEAQERVAQAEAHVREHVRSILTTIGYAAGRANGKTADDLLLEVARVYSEENTKATKLTPEEFAAFGQGVAQGRADRNNHPTAVNDGVEPPEEIPPAKRPRRWRFRKEPSVHVSRPSLNLQPGIQPTDPPPIPHESCVAGESQPGADFVPAWLCTKCKTPVSLTEVFCPVCPKPGDPSRCGCGSFDLRELPEPTDREVHRGAPEGCDFHHVEDEAR